jgi:protein-disulfide isomerase
MEGFTDRVSDTLSSSSGHRRKGMLKRFAGMALFLAVFFLIFSSPASSEEDKLVRAAIDTLKNKMGVPREVEVKFLEKKEGPFPDFYSIKLLLLTPGWDVPLIVYVDRAGERVIVGTLFVKGEDITRKEAGEARPSKIDLRKLEVEKSPFRGASGAQITIVEFSNFECPFCLDSWTRMKEMLEKYPREIKYVFKHFPFQTQGETFALSEMAAAAQPLGNEAFWLIHDYLFSGEGQALNKSEKGVVKQRIEQILKEKNFEVKAFEEALENGKARKRVEEDMALGNRYRISGTPTGFINGDLIQGPITEETLGRYLRK